VKKSAYQVDKCQEFVFGRGNGSNGQTRPTRPHGLIGDWLVRGDLPHPKNGGREKTPGGVGRCKFEGKTVSWGVGGGGGKRCARHNGKVVI